ncbi:hypothetical protein ALC62_13795 [Cyphomyrmex costatus]|uniref:Uncharacterized protein n=1 Tax=Cyphomyrmex costatus TaxID=456900 RepID=A0A151I9A9_9HYME|nr:hypothetical protein ALC62_13795 [Cyphomyrmex costatus]
MKSAHFAVLIGDRSLEALKTSGFKSFCGLGRATIRLLDKERKEFKQKLEIRPKKD